MYGKKAQYNHWYNNHSATLECEEEDCAWVSNDDDDYDDYDDFDDYDDYDEYDDHDDNRNQ